MNVADIIQALARWIHVVAGITWIGLLYYFNWMNGHIAATFDADTKRKVVPELMPRVLFWFRWGAAWTWFSGMVLLAVVYYHGGIMFDGMNTWGGPAFAILAATFLGVFVYDALFKTVSNHKVAVGVSFVLVAAFVCLSHHFAHLGYRAYVIHLGALFGTCMAFNVWFRIWPAQQKIITAIKNGEAPDGALAALAGQRSKHNTYMSVPLVWAMINAHHPVGLTGSSVIWLIGAVALGWFGVSHLYRLGGKVKGF